MKLTPLGLALRKIRLEKNMLLGEMAIGVGISSSMLSGIEYGKKKPTLDFCEAVIKFISLDKQKADELRTLVSKEIEVFSFRPANDVQREAMLLFARHISLLDEGAVDRIRDVLKEEGT